MQNILTDFDDTILHIRVFLRDTLALVSLMCRTLQNIWEHEAVENGFCCYHIKDFL